MNSPSGVDEFSAIQLKTATKNAKWPEGGRTGFFSFFLFFFFVCVYSSLFFVSSGHISKELMSFVICWTYTDVNILCIHDQRGSVVKRRLDRAWMERALSSMNPMFCSACACLAPPLHTPSPISHSIHFLPLYLPQLLQPHPPHPHRTLPYPAPQCVEGGRKIGWPCVSVCSCGMLFSTTGTTWRPMRGLDSVTDQGWCKTNVHLVVMQSSCW